MKRSKKQSKKFNPLVSVIVPTYNSTPTLQRCLQSIKDQTYSNFELIVVDNNSIDDTKKIAKKFTPSVFNKGNERSAQVNYGVKKSSGEFVYKVDADFVLDPEVLAECVARASEGFDAVVVHNSPDTSVSWIARTRKFEVDMYKYNITHSSARFVARSVYDQIGGFDESVTAGEDYDFQNKLNRAGVKVGFVAAEALHLGEPKSLWPHLKKYYAYGRDFINYTRENEVEAKTQLSPVRGVYLRNWQEFVRHPLQGARFIGYSLMKFGAGGLGYITGKIDDTFRG